MGAACAPLDRSSSLRQTEGVLVLLEWGVGRFARPNPRVPGSSDPWLGAWQESPRGRAIHR